MKSSRPCSVGHAGGFDYSRALTATHAPERLVIMAGAIEWVLAMQQEDAARETCEEGKKRAHRRYNDAVLALSKAFALTAASDEAREIREEVGFFQAIRAAMAKSATQRKERRRSRAGDSADCQPRGRIDRDCRYFQGVGHSKPGYFHPLG